MLKRLDNLSSPITLFYKGFPRHSSIISGIITILTYTTIIILGVVFSIDFLFKKNPIAYFYNRFIYDIGIFSFNNSGIFHFIYLGQKDNLPYDNKSIYVIGVNEHSNIINDDTNMILYDHWIYEPCNNQHIGDLKDYLNDYKHSFYNGLCINKFYNKTIKNFIDINDKNFKYPIIEHGSSNPNSNPYGIFILRCQNHSELNKTNCYDKNTSDEKAIEVDTIDMFFIDHYIDVRNYNNPLYKFYHKISNKIILSSYTINHLNYEPLKLNTHSGIIFNINSELNSFGFDFNEKLIINETNTGIYGSFYFWIQNQMEIYDRTYQKIQDVSANIGGISKLLTFIGYCLNYFFAKITLINDLSNDIFKKIDKSEKKINLQEFKLTNKSNSSNKICTEHLFKVPKQKISTNSKRENNILYNNMINNDISKANLKNDPFIKKNIQLSKINIKQILHHYLCCIKNNNIIKIENIRKKILSEEKFFSSYFIIRTLNDNILKRNQNFNNNIKKNKNWIPFQNIYKLGKNLN